MKDAPLMEPCPICLGSAHKLRPFATRKGSDWSEPSNSPSHKGGTKYEQVDLFVCGDCGMEFLEPQPSDEWLRSEYQNYFAKRGDASCKKMDFLRLLESTGVDFTGLQVLDVGGGEGWATQALMERWPGARATVLEPGSLEHLTFPSGVRWVQASVESYLAGLAKDSYQTKFDVIFLFDVLEHLRTPRHTLQALCQTVAQSGTYLIGTFPWVGSLSRELLGSHWPQYKIEHLHYFSFRSLRRLENALGLQRVSLRPHFKNLTGRYLLGVGENFGPDSVRTMARVGRRFLPRRVLNQSVQAGFGELFWLSRKS